MTPINVSSEQTIFEGECKNYCVTSLQTKERNVKRRTLIRTNAVSDCECENKSDTKPLNKAVKSKQIIDCGDKRRTGVKPLIWSVISDQKVTISVAMMISLTIYLMLIQQSVEINPGPCKARQTIKIITFNTNGLGDKSKLKRLLKKLEQVVNNGGLALLQELHIVTTDYLKLLWKNKFSSNCVSTNSAGVITLFNNDYEVVDEYSDNDGRALIVAIKIEQNKYIVVNTYYPYDHKKGLVFSNNLYEEILRIQQNYPDFDTVYAGDINTCLTADDCLNRNRPKIEETLSTMIQENNKVIEVNDANRSKNPTEGFTWRRGECYSRLDYVFLSKALISKVSKTKIDWAFEKSDHAALIIELFEDDTPTQGPGLIKINVKILEDPTVTKQIESEITEMMNQTDISWNPHARLEFLKVSIRSVFASKVMKIKRKINENITDLEEEINQIEELKLSIALEQSKLNCEKIFNVRKIDNAITALKSKLHTLRTKLSESIKFILKAK